MTPSQRARAERAQVQVVALAWRYAQEHVDGEPLAALAVAARKSRETSLEFWRDVLSRLRSWNSVHAMRPSDAAVLFDGIAGTLGADVTWKTEVARG